MAAPGEERGLLFTTGASGSGKSSFAQAGLLPALQAYYAERHLAVRHAVFRPGAHPLAARDDALGQLSGWAGDDPAVPIQVLIIDQFEELFGQSPQDERQALFRWLAEQPPFSKAHRHIIATLRSDYLNELFEVQPVWETAKRGVELRAMRAAELQDAIQRPIQSQYPQGEKRMEPALVERLARDTAEEATYLPLLQVTLEELWKKGRLVLSQYGTLSDAIKQRANQVWAYVDYDAADPHQRRSAAEQAAILELFLSLVNVSTDDDPRRDVRISRALTDLAADQRRLAADLSRARLLSVEDLASGETVNIIHETLIRNWDQLREAVSRQRQQLRQRGRFEQQLQLWLANRRSPDYLLLTNVQLAEARALEKAGDIALRNLDARTLLAQSIEFAEAERQRELDEARKLAESERRRAEEQTQANRRTRALNLVITVVGVLALTAALIAGFFGWQANQNLTTSNQNAATAQSANTQSIANLSAAQSANTQAALNLSGAQTQESAAQTQEAATRAASTQVVEQRNEAQHQARISQARALASAAIANLNADPQRSILLALQAVSITYTLDNATVVPEAEDALHQAVQAWHLRQVLTGHIGGVNSLAYSPDSLRLATASDDGTAKVWDAATGQELFTLMGHTREVTSIAFSPNGQRLATASADGMAKVWSAATGQELFTLIGHTGWVTGVCFSSDGLRLATASGDGTAKIWEAATGRELLTLSGYIDFFESIAFSPIHGGQRLATGSYDGSVELWDTATSQELLTLSGHTDAIQNIAFSLDGFRLATASLDGTARVWDSATGQELLRLSNYGGEILRLGFFDVAFSPDGQRLAAAGRDGTAKIWDTDTGEDLLALPVSPDSVFSAVAFSPQDGGRRLATGNGDGRVQVWDTVTGQELLSFAGHSDLVTRITFSPTSSRLATASDDGTAAVWDATTGEELLRLGDHLSPVNDVAFSPDGRRLATGDLDGTVTVWDAATGKELLRLDNPGISVNGLAFSPDGRRLATAHNNRMVRVWDAATGQPTLSLTDFTSWVSSVAFSPDGKALAVSTGDGIARLYAASIEDLMALARSRLTRTLTVDECRQYLQLDTCPPTP